MKQIKLVLCSIFMWSSIFVNAQPLESIPAETGIKWVTGFSWEQVKQKAKAEHKYIFIDCYATWCMPCKMMDKVVYTNDTVSDFSNSNFISVKVQMDTSKADNEAIKKWYSDAHSINEEYKVRALPTFLFISPTGKLVHKGQGYYPVQQFVQLMRDALNPEKQYFTLITNYQKGNKDYSKMQDLINTAYRIDDLSTARTIAKDYIENHLLKLKKSDLYSKANLEFIRSNTFTSKDKGFQFLYNNASQIDKQMRDSTFVEVMAYSIISREEVKPAMTVAVKSEIAPNWETLGNTIKNKYNSYYSDFVITEAKMRWNEGHKNWPEFCQNTVKLVNQFLKNADDGVLAVSAWNIFLHSIDKGQLETALQWTKHVIERSRDSSNILPAVMDTHANLLYKIGYLFENIKENETAISIEKTSIELWNKSLLLGQVYSVNAENIKKGEATVKKMNAGIPTWTQE